jgi:hypothetical protein
MLKVPSRNKATGANAVTKAVILVSMVNILSSEYLAESKRLEVHLEELVSDH